MPDPSTHSPAMKFFWMADMYSSKVSCKVSCDVSCLSYEAGTLVVKGPAGDQELHGDGVVARAKPVLVVERIRRLDRAAIDLDAEPGTVRNGDLAALDLQRLARQRLAILPDPMGVDRGDLAGGGGTNIGEHGKRNIEMVVGVRAPSQPVVPAGLGHTDRALHGPEMGIGQRDIDRTEPERMRQLPPVGCDHVGRGGKPRGAPELRHDLAAGEAGLGAAGVLRIGEDAVHILAEADSLVERPGAVRVQRHTRIGKALGDRSDGLDLRFAAQHAALQFEIGKAVEVMGCFGEPHDGLGRHRLLMAQPEPVDRFVFACDISETGLAAVADKEEIAERLDAGALLALAEQGGDRQAKMLAEQVEQRGLHCRHRVDHHAQVKGLLAAAAGVAVGEFGANGGQDVVAGADGLPDHEIAGVFQRLPDLLPARHLTDAGMAGIVGEDDDVAGEEWRMRAAQIEEHAVASRDRDHLHVSDARRAGKSGEGRLRHRLLLPCAVWSAAYSAACILEAPAGSFFTSAVSSAISVSFRSVSGGRTGPESRPITFMPALMIETA